MRKPVIVAAGGIVRNTAYELLMIFRRGKWDLPKGKLDAGETIEQCAVREVQEETGLQEIILDKAAGITFHEYYDNYLKAEVIKETHWFLMHIIKEQTLIPQTEEDIEIIKWANETEMEYCLKNSYPNIIEIIYKTTKRNPDFI